MEQTAEARPPRFNVVNSVITLPLFAATAAVGGVLCMLFLLRRRVERQARVFLPPAAAGSSSVGAAAETTPGAVVLEASSALAPPQLFLDKSRKKMRLEEKHAISHDTHRFRFSLEHPHQILGLPVGKHLKLFAPAAAAPADASSPLAGAPSPAQGNSSGEGRSSTAAAAAAVKKEEIERKYTPVTGDEFKGYVDLVIKVYRKGEDARYPEGGIMSQYLHALQPGQYIDVQGPVGKIEYLGNGSFSVSRKLLPPTKRVGMLSGGTGITPMFQLINAILNNPSDGTSLTLLYASKTEADILLKKELDALAEQHRDQLQVHYTVAAASSSWPSFQGFIDRRMIERTMPPPAADTLIFVCGSPVMVSCCKRDLLEFGYAKESILNF